MTGLVHNWHAWNFSDSSFEIFIVGGDDVTPIRLHSINKAIICISALMITFKPLKSWIFCQFKGETESMAHFFEFGDDAVGYARNTLCKKSIHHRIENVHLVLNAKIDEVGINKNVVWWA